MKNLKKLLTCMLAGFMVICSCMFFVACDGEPETQTPTTPTEEAAETPVSVKLSAQEAEWVYYNALLNSLRQNTRHETLKHYGRFQTEGFVLGSTTVVVLKDGVSCIKEDDEYSWVVDGKLYTEKDKKYYTQYGPIDIHAGALEWAQIQIEADTEEITFLGGEQIGDECLIGVRINCTYGGKNIVIHYNAKIKSNLIISFSISNFTHAELSDGDIFNEGIISYENVNFPKAIPTDLNTYTKAD